MNSLGLYIHVPFCGKKCSYCDFYSVSYNKNTVDDFVRAVVRNLRYYSDKTQTVDTVYFGGGTPSLLTPPQIDSIINEICMRFALSPKAEITLEANPNTVTLQKLADIRRAGINRLSLGIQSMMDNELKFLGRSHTAERASKAINDAFYAGFENISCDLMLGIPYQTQETLEYSIKTLAGFPIQHVSAYILKTEEGTPFNCEEIHNLMPDEDTLAELYLTMTTLLEEYGFLQYEISNFTKKSFESRHNCRYWKCLDYLGIGPAAHSCYKNKRFAVERDIRRFIESGFQPTYITDSSPCGFEERSMLSLRLKSGLDITQTGEHRADIEKKIPMLIKAGYAEFDGKSISLTPKGFLISNSIIEYLIFE